MGDFEYMGEPLSFWRSCSWWPEGREARVRGGYAGHDHELTVNIEGYEYPGPEIPDEFVKIIAAIMPDAWVIDNRGTRIECHPSGRRYGGYLASDVSLLKAALFGLGLAPQGSPRPAGPS